MSGALEPLLVAARLVQFAAAMLLLGAPAFALGLMIVARRAALLQQEFQSWLRRCVSFAAIAALVSAVLWLDAEAGIMGDGWDRMLDPDTIEAVLFDTVFGRAWCWHLGLEISILGLVAVTTARGMRGGMTSFVAVLALGHMTSLAWAGHAVMHPGLWHVLVQIVHLVAGGLWLGSLPALFRLAALARREGADAAQDALRRMLPFYSRVGYAAVGLVMLTGLLNSWFLVGSTAALVTTPFGLVLLTKILLVLFMIGVAAANRLVLQPMILTPDCDGALPARALWWSVGLEQAIGGFVLAAVSVLGTLPPAIAR